MIAIPLIFAVLGASESAGIIFGVLLVVVGLGWTLLGLARCERRVARRFATGR